MFIEDLDKYIPGCRNFTWREFLTLPQWKVAVFPKTEGIYRAIVNTGWAMEKVREILQTKIVVTSGYRPPTYNVLIGGAPASHHMNGMACDFVAQGFTAEKTQDILSGHLERLGLRMEKGTLNWTHVDMGRVTHSRIFTA